MFHLDKLMFTVNTGVHWKVNICKTNVVVSGASGIAYLVG